MLQDNMCSVILVIHVVQVKTCTNAYLCTIMSTVCRPERAELAVLGVIL